MMAEPSTWALCGEIASETLQKVTAGHPGGDSRDLVRKPVSTFRDHARSPFHPHAASRARRCGGTGAMTRTGALFLDIGTTTSRACSCSPGASGLATNLI